MDRQETHDRWRRWDRCGWQTGCFVHLPLQRDGDMWWRMKDENALLIAVLACLASSTFAAARVVVPSLPEAVRPLAEVETNVVFSTGSATDDKWILTIERDSAGSRHLPRLFACLKPHFPAKKFFTI